MNVSIRALGIASSIFWILLIAFIALSAYSFRDLNFSLGEPIFTAASDGQLIFSLPLFINNRGYCSVKELHLMTAFSNADGAEISRVNTFVPVIPRGENVAILHNVTLNMDSVLENAEQYLFNDSSLIASIKAELTLAELLPTQISTNFTFPWGAPFCNFVFGQSSFRRLNATDSAMSVPMSFENHATYDLTGNIRVELIDNAGSLLGESQNSFCLPQYLSYEGNLVFNVPLNVAALLVAHNMRFDVYFSTPLFEYGPLVIAYG